MKESIEHNRFKIPTGQEAIAMALTRFGACGLALVFLASASGSIAADAPLADAAEKGNKASVRADIGHGSEEPAAVS